MGERLIAGVVADGDGSLLPILEGPLSTALTVPCDTKLFRDDEEVDAALDAKGAVWKLATEVKLVILEFNLLRDGDGEWERAG